MSAVLIKNLPASLHQRLKNEAQINHRSLNKEIIWRLEQTVTGTARSKTLSDIVPFRTRRPVTNEFVDFAKRWGRE